MHETAKAEVLAGAIFLIAALLAFVSGVRYRSRSIALTKQRDEMSKEILHGAIKILYDAKAVAACLALEKLDQ